jgi:hypothetical protein
MGWVGDLLPEGGCRVWMTAFPASSSVNSTRSRVLGYRKAGGGEGKWLGSREAGFDMGKERGSTGEHRSGSLMAARVTCETMWRPPGDVDGRLIGAVCQHPAHVQSPRRFMRQCYCWCRDFSTIEPNQAGGTLRMAPA